MVFRNIHYNDFSRISHHIYSLLGLSEVAPSESTERTPRTNNIQTPIWRFVNSPNGYFKGICFLFFV